MATIDIEKNIVSGYFASFDNIDSHGDMFLKGAFTESIDKFGVNGSDQRRIKHLAFHDQTQIVGEIVELKEDSKGLYFESKILDTTLGKDALVLYKTFKDLEHSVGFRNVKGGYEDVTVDETTLKALDNGVNDLRMVKAYNQYTKINNVQLFEGSYVAFGSNRFTPNTTIKSQSDLSVQLDLIKEQIELMKQIKSDTVTVEFPEFEIIKLNEMLHNLKTFEPKQPEPNEPKNENKIISNFNPVILL